MSKTQELIFKIMDLSIDAIFIDDTSGNILMCNHAAEKMFGYNEGEMIGLNISDLIPKEDCDYLQPKYKKEDLLEEIYIPRINKRKDGTLFPTEVNSKIVSAGESEYLIAFVRDMTEDSKIKDRLYYLSNYDELTELRNRRSIISLLSSQKESYCLAMIDIDSFKHINDTYGHMVGDLFLKSFGFILKENKEIEAGRFGGEEFLVLIKNPNLKYAKRVMENVLMDANKTLSLYGGIHFSCGVTMVNDLSVDSAISKTDKLMYQAKASGKNQVIAE